MSKMVYPKGSMVVVRDCSVAICLNVNPGAVLMSVLLFWYDNPHKGDFWNEEEQTFTMCRTQGEIEVASCRQIDVKTIHDTAVPLLSLLGFLTVTERMNGNLYTLHIGRITDAFAAYEKSKKTNNPKVLRDHLKTLLQLESALIELTPDELESALINKRRLYLQIERALIAIRDKSNCKRGRKPRPQAPVEAEEPPIQTLETIRDIYQESNGDAAIADHPLTPSFSSGVQWDAQLIPDEIAGDVVTPLQAESEQPMDTARLTYQDKDSPFASEADEIAFRAWQRDEPFTTPTIAPQALTALVTMEGMILATVGVYQPLPQADFDYARLFMGDEDGDTDLSTADVENSPDSENKSHSHSDDADDTPTETALPVVPKPFSGPLALPSKQVKGHTDDTAPHRAPTSTPDGIGRVDAQGTGTHPGRLLAQDTTLTPMAEPRAVPQDAHPPVLSEAAVPPATGQSNDVRGVLSVQANSNTIPPHPEKTPTNEHKAVRVEGQAPAHKVAGKGRGKSTDRQEQAAPAPMPKCDPKEVHARINANRGYALEERVDIIRENTAIKSWANLHTLDELDAVLTYLTTIEPYWSRPENRNRIGGVTLAKETPKALAEIERRKKQQATPPRGGVRRGSAVTPEMLQAARAAREAREQLNAQGVR